MAPRVPVSANRGDGERPREPSTLYKLVVTPLVFVSFLLSLAIVDLRYSALRAHYHADEDHRRLPGWLHRIVYRYRPYRYTAGDGAGAARTPTSPGSPGSPGSDSASGAVGEAGEDYYHSKQRKLMKMEAEEAFEMRGVVVLVLGFAGLVALWAAWRVVSWSVGLVSRLIF